MDCLFCKIISKEIPSHVIYEDENTLAFLDIAQDVEGHTLVVPKKHSTNVLDVATEDWLHVMNTVRKIAKHYVEDCGYDGVNIINASGKDAQQSVFHLHIHIIPRRHNDGVDAWPHFTGCATPLLQMWEKLKIK